MMHRKMPFSISNEGRSLSNLFNSNESNSEALIIERQNLLSVFKLVIKDLLNSSLKNERLVEKESFPLKHFFIVFEHILLHGYTGKKVLTITTAANRRDLWPVIDLITRKSSDTHLADISVSSKEMTNIRTPLGRVRAWLRLALMQKHLADYFKVLIEQKQELKELYDNEALILSEAAVIITGLLIGLNVLDFNFCLKEIALDIPLESTIHYSLYLRERRLTMSSTKNAHPPGAIRDAVDEFDECSSLSSVSSSSPIIRGAVPGDDTVVITNTNDVISLDESNADSAYEQRLASILDQKHYVEELNRKLERMMTGLQERVSTLEQANKSLTEESTSQKSRVEQLEEQLAKVTAEKEQTTVACQRKIETLSADIAVERETYQQSRTGFDSIYHELQRKYEEERASKQQIETVYQTQVSQNNDILESTKVMEKDIEIKTTLYDRIKEDCDRLAEQLQIEKTQNEVKERQIKATDKENQMLRKTINELEISIDQITGEKQALGDTNDELSRTLAKLDSEKSSLETDLQVEQECQQRLQKALNNEKEKVSTLQFDIHELNLMKQEYTAYKKDMLKQQREFEKKFQEQEETIQELALKLEASITREDEFREKDGLRSSTWVKDEDVKDCFQCKKEFNTIRRKHHCRNCGQIFCEACASTKLTLASSSKPVRVCDGCCKRVLAHCAVKSP